MQRLISLVALVMVALWLPATLRCELELVPGLEALGCKTPCNPATGDGCSDGCAVLDGSLFKVSNDVRVSAPFGTDVCDCPACGLCAALRGPSPAPDQV